MQRELAWVSLQIWIAAVMVLDGHTHWLLLLMFLQFVLVLTLEYREYLKRKLKHTATGSK